MKKLFLSVLLIASLALTGCGPIYQTTYSYEPPANINARSCIVQCQQNRMQCNFACSSQNNQCEMMAQQSAMFQYRAYVSQQRAAGQPVTATVQNFFDDSSCQMQSYCNCTPQYNQCYQFCGGRIIAQQKCVAFCGDDN